MCFSAQLSAPQPPSSFNSVAPLLGGDSPNDRNVDLFDDWGSRSQSSSSSNASLTLPELRKVNICVVVKDTAIGE